MGLFTWSITQMMTPKFWKLVKKDGFLKTYQRGHKTIRHSQYLGGHNDALKPVGRDEFGNTYFEDLAADHFNNRRYVEYADHSTTYRTANSIPPKWDGWLKYQYVEAPSEKHFVSPFY